ncbi:hypothetical protein [Actinocorallia populi]|uniref:hypothetical protein n=1 Tax=Actinocorallia populi TaxID=2079200 RepID=UPI000D08681D|nr:hypothetical protein [Actinocorallia populi]
MWLVNPRSADAWLVEPLEEACRAGGSSLYVNGIDPGYSGDILALAALSLAETATRVAVQEIFDYGDFTGVTFGFGTAPEAGPVMMALPGVVASAARVVNAIEAVCAAEPGLLTVADLPAVLVGRVMR